jgi:hypothetical protein
VPPAHPPGRNTRKIRAEMTMLGAVFFEVDVFDLVPLGLALLVVAVALATVLLVRHWHESKNRRDG